MSNRRFFVIILLLSTGTVVADSKKDTSFAKWLGPQTNATATPFRPVVGERIDHKKQDKLSRYDISLEIVHGADFVIPASENAVVSFNGTEFTKLKMPEADKDAHYLFAQLKLAKNQLGWRFYTLNVRVTDGPLKGAVVHFRDGKIQDNISDPCIAIYKVPTGVHFEKGKVPFEVVAAVAK